MDEVIARGVSNSARWRLLARTIVYPDRAVHTYVVCTQVRYHCATTAGSPVKVGACAAFPGVKRAKPGAAFSRQSEPLAPALARKNLDWRSSSLWSTCRATHLPTLFFVIVWVDELQIT
jgi:hypothetical protein